MITLKTDRPLPLKWDINQASYKSTENEIMHAIKLLVKLGYRKWSDMRHLKSKIQGSDPPVVNLMPDKIKDYFKKRRNDDQRIKSLKYQQYLVDQQAFQTQYTEEFLKTLHQKQGIDFLERKMENTQGNMLEKYPCFKEYIDARKQLQVSDIDNLKFSILGIQYPGQEGELVCNEFYDLADAKQEEKKSMMIRAVKPNQKKLSAEVAEQLDNYLLNKNLKQQIRNQMLQNRKMTFKKKSQAGEQFNNIGQQINQIQNQEKELEDKLKILDKSQEESLENDEKIDHWLHYAENKDSEKRFEEAFKPQTEKQYSKKDFKEQLLTLKQELATHQKPIQFLNNHELDQIRLLSRKMIRTKSQLISPIKNSAKTSPLKTKILDAITKNSQIIDQVTTDIRALEIVKSVSHRKQNSQQLKIPSINNKLESLSSNNLFSPQSFSQQRLMTSQQNSSAIHSTQQNTYKQTLFKESFLTQKQREQNIDLKKLIQAKTLTKFYPLTARSPGGNQELSIKNLRKVQYHNQNKLQEKTVNDVIKSYQDYSNQLYDHIKHKIESGIMDKKPVSNASTSAFSLPSSNILKK
ncbi:UNKNOWN [Stylonychia lemnae]|uniref:Uncharacterized protein n=1 Tax=Stylonychia lemnae TaxID=5949 RepID=A0A078B4H7_STYLE|nr:UNKNOWN [Stylonychia lemnae]|eukprot:CDW89176.1 UNKNOWN [Stylonychia lemnae]